MIKTTDLKLQIDELTKQNDMVLIELDQVKKMLSNAANNNSSQGSGQNQSQSAIGGGSGVQQASSAQQGQSQSLNQGNSSGQVTDLANELLKIKDLVEKLEQKTSQYVCSQTNGSLTEKDAVNLVLTLMNGMVDWASEFVSSKSQQSGQLQ